MKIVVQRFVVDIIKTKINLRFIRKEEKKVDDRAYHLDDWIHLI